MIFGELIINEMCFFIGFVMGIIGFFVGCMGGGSSGGGGSFILEICG